MSKLDLRKELKHLFSPSAKEPQMVHVPEMNYLAIDGAGNPNNSQVFDDAVQALYGLSFTIKFMLKQRVDGTDYGVMPLEGLWWTEDMAKFSLQDKEAWYWTLLIMQPEFVTEADVTAAVEQLRRKGKDSPALDRVRFIRWEEGLSAQIMHIGPYATEEPTISRLHDYMANQGYERFGKHHEIYLGDPRRSAPEKLKTIIRQPVGHSARA